MLFTKRIKRIVLALIATLLFSLNITCVYAYEPNDTLYLGGFPAGFLLNTTTVEVVGLCEVVTSEGLKCPARDCNIQAGDIIEKLNDREINSTYDLNTAVNESYSQYELFYSRAGQQYSTFITPAIDQTNNQKRLGLLVKDSVNGIGTITYIDKSNNTFASLGHPVNDESNQIIKINGGSVYGCVIYDIKKGVRGNPGELKGAFDNFNMIGKASKNCESGIYGEIAANLDVTNLKAIKPASIEEVKMGKAEIYSTINGSTPEKYSISIVKIDEGNKDNRNFVIKIDDAELIEKSGGIVQGMSGSPIVQSGKLIGAITHVFVNDPTRGYGISIDKMLNSY